MWRCTSIAGLWRVKRHEHDHLGSAPTQPLRALFICSTKATTRIDLVHLVSEAFVEVLPDRAPADAVTETRAGAGAYQGSLPPSHSRRR